jgi:hypothetical protein
MLADPIGALKIGLGPDIGQELLQGRAVERGSREAAIIDWKVPAACPCHHPCPELVVDARRGYRPGRG